MLKKLDPLPDPQQSIEISVFALKATGQGIAGVVAVVFIAVLFLGVIYAFGNKSKVGLLKRTVASNEAPSEISDFRD